MVNDLYDTIHDNTKGPVKVSGDACSVEQHPLSEQVAADRHLASKDATKSNRRGLLFNKIVPTGGIRTIDGKCPREKAYS
jgi:hypothetical protein